MFIPEREGLLNLFGVGSLEIAVVFLVAFLALGPGKSIEMARTAGKFMRDLRRTFDEVTSAVSLEDDDKRPSQRTNASPPRSQTGARPYEPPSSPASTPKEDSSPENPP
jgi:sec-independent protein translocase protein TatA